MVEARTRTPLSESVLLAVLLVIACAAVWGASAGYMMIAAPTLVFVLIALGGYAIYRWQWKPGTEEDRPVLWSGPTDVTVATFRVCGMEGVCPGGIAIGDRIEVRRSGKLSPDLCEHAAAALRRAANDPEVGVEHYCCPIEDHRLVFEREEEPA